MFRWDVSCAPWISMGISMVCRHPIPQQLAAGLGRRWPIQESALWGAFDAFDCGAHDGKITLDETWPWGRWAARGRPCRVRRW